MVWPLYREYGVLVLQPCDFWVFQTNEPTPIWNLGTIQLGNPVRAACATSIQQPMASFSPGTSPAKSPAKAAPAAPAPGGAAEKMLRFTWPYSSYTYCNHHGSRLCWWISCLLAGKDVPPEMRPKQDRKICPCYYHHADMSLLRITCIVGWLGHKYMQLNLHLSSKKRRCDCLKIVISTQNHSFGLIQI